MTTIPKKPTLTVVADTKPVALPEGHVKVFITKAGGGKVQTGTLGADKRPQFFQWRDEVILPERVARALEDRHFAEIDE
jgi:hypothetical protein